MDEYLLRCAQGADIAEVVVEGELDRDVIHDALCRWGLVDVVVLDAAYIQVEDAAVAAVGCSLGVKGRLLTVALALDRLSHDSMLLATVVVVADRDYDGGLENSVVLVLTDGHSMESYAASAAALDRFLRLALGRGPLPGGARGEDVVRRATCTGSELFRRVQKPAVQIAAVRLVLGSISPPVALLGRWTDYASVTADGHMAVDCDRLLKHVIEPVRSSVDHADLISLLPDYHSRVLADPFAMVRGHDFVVLLLKLLRTAWGRRLAGGRFTGRDGERTLARTLMTAIDPSDLDMYPLFSTLRARLNVRSRAMRDAVWPPVSGT